MNSSTLPVQAAHVLHGSEAVLGVDAQQFNRHESQRAALLGGAVLDLGPEFRVDVLDDEVEHRGTLHSGARAASSKLNRTIFPVHLVTDRLPFDHRMVIA